ncbi:MAG: hypothetical protein ACYDIC_17405 [Desulfobaccales bacterium]
MPEPSLMKINEPPPLKRQLQAFAFDPSLGLSLESARMNRVTIPVPWEYLTEGPVGEYLEVVDIDPASGVFYPPVNLNRDDLLAQDGLSPSEENPQFHQQMVYAVAMATIARFEKALGRRVLWSVGMSESADGQVQAEYVQQLRIYPHASRMKNAYYDRKRVALLFGYFPASKEDPTNVVDGGMVFTCLSHDIIVHETTHAILDALRDLFGVPTNPDMQAFHEALADLVTLFQRFTYPEVISQQTARTRGDMTSENLLGQIARQFGQALGEGHALRDAIGEIDSETGKWRRKQPDPQAYTSIFEPHARSQILVSAVIDAFLAIHKARTADLLRIATGGTGVLPPGEIHPDLVARLAREMTTSAEHILNMCIRALDYLPPVDATFGDYLRAIITADYDLVRDDRYDYRTAFIEAFWRHGIQLRNVRSLSEESLLWRPPDEQGAQAIREFLRAWLHSLARPSLKERSRQKVFEIEGKNRFKLVEYIIRQYREQPAVANTLQQMWLCYGPDRPFSIDSDQRNLPRLYVRSVRPSLRITLEGTILNDLQILISQRRRGYLDPYVQEQVDKNQLKSPPDADFFLYGGCTLIMDLDTGEVRYAIGKRVDSERRLGEARLMALEGLPK